MAAAALAEANEKLEELREELEEQTDHYETKLDDLTAEFEDRIEELENTKDELEGKVEEMVDEQSKLLMEHEASVAETKLEHEAALHHLASNSGDAWEVMYDEEDNEYFRNKITEEVVWEDPRPMNHEGMMLKKEVDELKTDFSAIKQSFEKSSFMQKALGEEIENLETTLKQERNEKLSIETKLQNKDKELDQKETEHQKHLRLREEHEQKLKEQHASKLKKSNSNTLQVRRELSEMRREAKEMMDNMSSELTDTFMVYSQTTPGNRKV